MKRFHLKTFAILLLLEATGVAKLAAAPNLQSVQTIDGVVVVQDHIDLNKFYYLKSKKQLATRDGKPDFRYSVNRYIGNRITNDSDDFWVRGVIKFTVETRFLDTNYQLLVKKIERQHGAKIQLRAAPINHSFNKLVYTLIEENEGSDQSSPGELNATTHNINASARDSQTLYSSSTQRFTIGLSNHDANLFWENFAKDNLSLSLGYGWEINGVVKDLSDQWQSSTYQVNDSLGIDVSSEQYPQLFNKNELWQRLSVAHSGVKLMCYDFLNDQLESLYYVLVELRFTTLAGKRFHKQYKFLRSSDEYEADINFELANNLKQGYEFRVQRLYLDGRRTSSDWEPAKDAWLDVSLTQSSNDLDAVEIPTTRTTSKS